MVAAPHSGEIKSLEMYAKIYFITKKYFLEIRYIQNVRIFFIDIEELLKNLKEGTLDPLDVLQAFQVDKLD